MIKFKIDVAKELENAGVNYMSIKKDKIISAGTLKKVKDGDMSLTLNSVGKICNIINRDIGEILEVTKDE